MASLPTSDHTSEDEELAWRLQYEEERSRGYGRPGIQHIRYSEQERRDRELAQQLQDSLEQPRSDYDGTVPRRSPYNSSAMERQREAYLSQYASSNEGWTRQQSQHQYAEGSYTEQDRYCNEQPYESLPPHHSQHPLPPPRGCADQHVRQTFRYAPSRHENHGPLSPRSVNREEPFEYCERDSAERRHHQPSQPAALSRQTLVPPDTHLDYAPRLQEQAFSDLRRNQDQQQEFGPIKAVMDDDSEHSDDRGVSNPCQICTASARSKQELLQDKNLVRCIEELGSSISDMSTGMVNDILRNAMAEEHQQTSSMGAALDLLHGDDRRTPEEPLHQQSSDLGDGLDALPRDNRHRTTSTGAANDTRCRILMEPDMRSRLFALESEIAGRGMTAASRPLSQIPSSMDGLESAIASTAWTKSQHTAFISTPFSRPTHTDHEFADSTSLSGEEEKVAEDAQATASEESANNKSSSSIKPVSEHGSYANGKMEEAHPSLSWDESADVARAASIMGGTEAAAPRASIKGRTRASFAGHRTRPSIIGRTRTSVKAKTRASVSARPQPSVSTFGGTGSSLPNTTEEDPDAALSWAESSEIARAASLVGNEDHFPRTALDGVEGPTPTTPLAKSKKKKRRSFMSFISRGSKKNEEPADENPSTNESPTNPSTTFPNISAGSVPVPRSVMRRQSHRQLLQVTRQSRSTSPPPAVLSGSSIAETKPPARRLPSAAAGGAAAMGSPSSPPPVGVGGQQTLSSTSESPCASCRKASGTFVHVLDKSFHPECFRCVSCNEVIDPKSQFKCSEDHLGQKHPHHRDCYMALYGIECFLCKQSIPPTSDGRVAFVRHPFFATEQMCIQHAEEPHRRCSGCQRFEPEDKTFIDLMDGDRCVCPSCCRSVIVDNNDVKPLWSRVLSFFEKNLGLPVWGPMRDIPILVVGSDALEDQMTAENNFHASSSHPMTAGLCLTEHARRFWLPSMRYESSTGSFLQGEATCFDVSQECNPHTDVFAILCLSGLPKDLTASILAHEGTHAWIKLHPKYNVRMPLPPQVEEGVAQLVAMLFLSEGLDQPPEPKADDSNGPTDEQLRQYFKFSIEREGDEIYGTGYRRAAMAYREIGIVELLNHIVQYRGFPYV